MLIGIILVLILILILWKGARMLAFIAVINFRTGNIEKALGLFATANKIGRLSPENLMNYGYLLIRTGELDLAYDILTKGLSLSSAKKIATKKRIESFLGLVAWKRGDLDSAIELMESAMEDFKTTNFYQNLGLMYVLKGDAQKAVAFNEEAYNYNAEDLIIADNLAESYAISGQIQKARDMYEKLLEKSPHFPEPYYCYGMLLIAEGEKERGIKLIEESLTKRYSFLSVKTKEEVEELLRQVRDN